MFMTALNDHPNEDGLLLYDERFVFQTEKYVC